MSYLLDLVGLLASPVARFGKRLTFEMRIVRFTRIEMRRAGYRTDRKRLRRTIRGSSFAEQLAQVPRDDDDLYKAIADVIEPSDADGVCLLRDTLTKAYEVRLAGSTPASRFSEERSVSQYSAIMGALDRIETGVVGGDDSASRDNTVFEYRLTEMHPLRAQEFRKLRQEWPATADLVGLLATTPDTQALLRRWINDPPVALVGAPPELLGLISEVAADVPGIDVYQLVVPFVESALERGIEPRGYWRLQQFAHAGVTDVGLAAEALADVRGYPLVEAAIHESGFEAAVKLLEDWETSSRREEVSRRLTLIEYYQGQARIDEAIALAKETAVDYDSTSAALLAVRGLMARHMMSRNPTHRSDLSAALLLVIDTRAKRRRWGLDSGAALATEIRVRRLLHDHQGALDIANGVGEIPATPAELKHPRMITEAALIHAGHGDLEVAKRLLASAVPRDRPQIEAVVAETEGRKDDAISHWLAAIDANDDWSEKTDLALQLAFHGVRSEFLDELSEGNPEVAAEITLVASLYGHQPGALEAARTFANREHRGAVFLWAYHGREGDHAAAAAVAAEGAARWSDPDLWLESARYSTSQSEHAIAIERLRSALAVAADSWGGRRTATRLLVEAQSATGDWASARNSAAELVAEEPGDSSAAWALVICEVRTSNLAAARAAWLRAGGPEPDGEMEVAAWIDLVRAYGVGIGTPRDALKIAARYSDSEAIRGALIGAFLTGEGRSRGQRVEESEDINESSVSQPETEGHDPDRDAFQALLAGYLRDFPDGGIRQVEIDPDNPLRSIQELVGERRESREIEEQIANGTLPVGVAGEVFGKSYLETLIARDSGPVFTGPPNAEAETAAFELAHQKGVVLDLSALVTIARLPDAIRTQLAGHFGNARVLSEHRSDATRGTESIHLDSGLSVHPGRDGEAPLVVRRDAEEVALAAEIADEVVASFVHYAVDSHPSVRGIPQLAETDFTRPFLLASDHAVTTALPVWIDDRPLIGVVRAAGGHAFDTPALLRHLRTEGSIDSRLLDLAEATLIASGYTGVLFNREVWDLAAQVASTPGGLIQAIKNGLADDLNGRAWFATAMIGEHVDDPGLFASYVHAAAQWIVNIAPDAGAAADNLQLLAGVLLRQPWMTSSTLPYCVGAFRATTLDGAPEILLRQIYVDFEELAVRADPNAAAGYAFELISKLDPPDAYRVRAAVLSRNFE